MDPLVSVVIPVHNRAAMVAEAIESVLAQTYASREVILVDDGSTDATPRVLAGYGAALRVVTTSRRGVSAARNSGVRAARGSLLALLDSDDLWHPDKLAVQVDWLRARPSVAACQTEEVWIRNGVRVNPRRVHRKYSGDIFLRCLPLCIVSPSAVMLPRWVFDRVGLFDERMPACEDYDLWLRIAAQFEMHTLPPALTIKRGGHADQLSRTEPALDRWRIYSLCKLLDQHVLDPAQRDAAAAELARKCRIYAGGCARRGRAQEAARYRALPGRYAYRSEPADEPLASA